MLDSFARFLLFTRCKGTPNVAIALFDGNLDIYSSNYYLHIKPLRLLHISREVKDSEEASSSSQ